jgi:hypothetical protein
MWPDMRLPWNAARRLALADRARDAVRHGVAVRRHAAGEVVALHRAGEALADRRAGDVHDLAGREHVDLQLGAGSEAFTVLLAEAELDQLLAGRDVRLRVVARHGLRQARGTAGAVRDLNGLVAIVVGGLDLRHPVRERFDDGDRHRLTRVREDARHAALAADQPQAMSIAHWVVP